MGNESSNVCSSDDDASSYVIEDLVKFEDFSPGDEKDEETQIELATRLSIIDAENLVFTITGAILRGAYKMINFQQCK